LRRPSESVLLALENMKAIPSARKKKGRGRPRIDAIPVNVRFPPAELAALDRWISAFGVPISRPEAVRRLVDLCLAGTPAKGRSRSKKGDTSTRG
jgi:hypothetical protein